MKTIYYETDSLLHRLNPLTKLLATLPILVFVALTTDPWTPFVFLIFVSLITLLLGRIPLTRFLALTLPLLLFLSVYFLTYPVFVRRELVEHSPIVLASGPLVIYQAAVTYSVATALRVSALLLLSLPFTLTTDSSAFIRALVQQGRLPYKIGYSTLAVFRFVPMLQSELQVIRTAHKVRGVSDRGGVYAFYTRLKRYAIPLLATAIRRAERTALAMDGRAFGAFPRRTYYTKQRFAPRDFYALAIFWLVCSILVWVLWWFRILGPLIFLQPG
jgi:energy-coupling factor transport system permease protein